MSGPTREQRQRWGRIGALTVRAHHDPKKYTEAARAKFIDSFADDLPPDLPPEERHARAAAAYRAHMLKLAEASARARRERARG